MEIDLRNGCCPPTFFDSKFTEIECESKNGSVIRGTVMEIQLLDHCSLHSIKIFNLNSSVLLFLGISLPSGCQIII